MKKVFLITLIVVILCATLAVSADTTLYAPDGRTIAVKNEDVNTWQSVGWYKYPVMKMYAPDCRSIVIAKSECTRWKNAGWYEYPFMYVYSADGRKMSIKVSDFATWYNVGWSCAPGYTMSTKWLTELTPSKKENLSVSDNKILLSYQQIRHCFVPSNLTYEEFDVPGAYAVYNLDKKYKFISGTLAALYSPSLKSSSRFNKLTDQIKVEIYADGVKVGESPAQKINDRNTVDFSAEVTGCSELKIRFVPVGNQIKNFCTYYDKFVFGNVKLYK